LIISMFLKTREPDGEVCFVGPFLTHVVSENGMPEPYQTNVGRGFGETTGMEHIRKDKLAKIADLGQALSTLD